MRTSTAGRLRRISAIVAIMTVFGFSIVPSMGAPKQAAAQSEGDVVLVWNLHAVNAFMNPSTSPTPGAGLPPQVAILHIAMTQGAIYDAVNMIDGGYQPYLAGLPEADESASKAAAVATAAHDVIVGVTIVPALSPVIIDRVDTLWENAISDATAVDGADAVAAGIAAGQAAAAAMLDTRANDGRFVPFALTPGTEPGEWRPAPPANVSDPNAWMAFVDPFLMESPSQFRTKGPHALKTGIYAKEYNEVKTLGAIDSVRSPEQEAIAQFFIVNPVEMYNRAFRTYAAAEGLSIAEQARLFAMLNLAGADAAINCFNDKAHFSFWRPITAIRLGDEDGNAKTAGDDDWTPLIATPPYSDHSSGYNCVTGAFMHTAEAFFGKGKTNFSLVRIVAGQPDVTRSYERFTDVIDDTIDARVYQGVHFRNADVQGAGIGRDVARWLEKHYFLPES